MREVVRHAAQVLVYGAFAATIGFFATSPPIRVLDDDQALLRLSVQHPGQPRGDCRQRTADELAKLPPQMRAPLDCPRERSPVTVRVELDGRAVIDAVFPPAGLRRDGASAGYRRLPISAGRHTLRVQLNDDARRNDFPYERVATLETRPGQIVLIDFDAGKGGLLIR